MSDSEADSSDGSTTTNRWKVHAVLLVTVAMTLTGISIVNVALPSIKSDLGANDHDLQWILAGYALSFGVILIPAGRLGDLFGTTSLYFLGIFIFAAASLFASLATDMTQLNIARIVQGLGSGILSPQILGIIQRNFQGPDRGRAMGAYGTVVAVSMGLAPLLGGILIELAGSHTGWRWTFIINIPVSLIALTLALRWFPKPLFRVKRTPAKKPNLDLTGVTLLGLAIFLFMFPFTTELQWTSPVFIALAVVSALLWVAWERGYKRAGKKPMVDLDILRDFSFSSGVLLATVYFFGVTAVWIIVAIYLQAGLGFTALEAGLVGLPSALLGALSARWAGKRVFTLGRRIVSAGIIIAICGLATTIFLLHFVGQGHLSFWWLIIGLAPVGLAQGAVVNPNQTLTLTTVPLEYAGSSGGVLQTGQRVGSATGSAVITGALFFVYPVAGWTTASMVAFFVIIVSLLVALVISLFDQRRRNDLLAGE